MVMFKYISSITLTGFFSLLCFTYTDADTGDLDDIKLV